MELLSRRGFDYIIGCPWNRLRSEIDPCNPRNHSIRNTEGVSMTTVDLLFDWFGFVHFSNKNKNCQLSYKPVK
jgi:hypothetical protein